MSFLLKKKKKPVENNECGCSCSCECASGSDRGDSPAAPAESVCCGEKVDGICCVKVLGSGCKNCRALYENAEKAVKAAGVNVEVEYITDLEKVMEYGVMTMPALVVNDRVVSMGKVLNAESIGKLLLG